MSGTRGVEVPLEHLTAELAAFPIASSESARLALIGFDPEMRGETGLLWRAAENAMIRAFPSFSVDEVVALRDWLWFNSTDTKQFSLVDYLRFVSTSTLGFSGNVFRPLEPPWSKDAHASLGAPDARARHFFRWVSFALPPDLLMAAHDTRGAVTAEVELVSPILARILHDRGFVEPHMHVTAALDFPLLWIGALHALAHPETREKDFYSPGADGYEGADLGHWLLRAAIARYILAAYLGERRQDSSLGNLDDYLREYVYPPPPPGLVDGEAGAARPPWRRANPDASIVTLLRFSLRELAQGRPDPRSSFASLQRLYARLTCIRTRWPDGFPDKRDEAAHADPIEAMFPARGPGRRTSEMEWVAESLDYLSREGKGDSVYAQLFWQVVRVRNRLYRHVVQRPMTPGLQWFVRFFARMKPARRLMPLGLLIKNAAVLCGVGKGLRSMEFRTSPEPDVDGTRRLVERARKAVEELVDAEHQRDAGLRRGDALRANGSEPGASRAAQAMPTEYGLVLHFSRDRGGRSKEGLPGMRGKDTHADPSWKHNLGYRFAWFYKQKRREAVAVATLLRRFPRTLRLFRAIDLCTDEMGIPTWVMAPVCRYVRQVGQRASAHLQSTRGEDLPPLRTTVHAGEDFVHLLGGLRRIDESIDMLQLGQGDRIGHGIALGINAESWARRTSGIAITRMERLLDLAWEWKFSTERAVDVSASRIQYLIDQLGNLSKEIFNTYSQPTQVVKFAELLRKEDEIRRLGFPTGPLPERDAYVESRSGEARVLKVTARAPEVTGEAQSPAGEGKILARAYGAEGGKGEIGAEPWILLFGYLIEPSTFERGQKTMLVDPSFEAGTLATLQTELRKKIAAAGITVEINPSSNLLISNLGDLKNHPLWRLKPPRGGDGAFPVAVCIGSDNPLTFTTRTREEYQLVYDTLTLAGLSDMEARLWLEEARESGLESRFTLPGPVDFSKESMWTSMDVDAENLEPLL